MHRTDRGTEKPGKKACVRPANLSRGEDQRVLHVVVPSVFGAGIRFLQPGDQELKGEFKVKWTTLKTEVH